MNPADLLFLAFALSVDPNVVLIMMESMSAEFMKHFGQSETLTPFLDSLYTRSISFRNFYSAGQLIADSIDDFFNNLVAFPKIEEEQQTEIIEIEGLGFWWYLPN